MLLYSRFCTEKRLHSERVIIYYLVTSATIMLAILLWRYILDYNLDDTLILFSTTWCGLIANGKA